MLTPFVNAAVEGTEFFAEVTRLQTILLILEGQVALANDIGRLVLWVVTKVSEVRYVVWRPTQIVVGLC